MFAYTFGKYLKMYLGSILPLKKETIQNLRSSTQTKNVPEECSGLKTQAFQKILFLKI